MDLEKLLSQDRSLKELYNSGLKWHDTHEQFKILQKGSVRYYFTKKCGLFHYEYYEPKCGDKNRTSA